MKQFTGKQEIISQKPLKLKAIIVLAITTFLIFISYQVKAQDEGIESSMSTEETSMPVGEEISEDDEYEEELTPTQDTSSEDSGSINAFDE